MPNSIEAGAIPIIAPRRKAAQLREQNVSSHPQHKSERTDRSRTPSLTGSPPCPVTQCSSPGFS